MDKLISEVKQRNVLWNRSNPRHGEKQLLDKEWNLVAQNTGFTKEEAKNKWRNVRDQFAKELRKLENLSSGDDELPPYTGKWRHFTALMFLKDTVVRRNFVRSKCAKTVYISDESNTNEGPILIEPEKDTSSFQRKRKNMESQDSLEFKILKTESKILSYLEKSDDEDLMFLKSLLPYFKQMSPVQKLRIRSQFQNIIIEEISDEVASS